jgi:hypothetical protein
MKKENPQNQKSCGFINGGAGRDRTDDPQTASLMLSQLSYSPLETLSEKSAPCVPVFWT